MDLPGEQARAPDGWRTSAQTYLYDLSNCFIYTIFGIMVAGLVLSGGEVMAQGVPAQDLPLVQERQNNLQRRHEDEQDRLEKLRRAPQDQPPQGQVIPRQDAPIDIPKGECRNIGNIEVSGLKVLSKSVSGVLLKPFVGACMGLPEIDEVLRTLSNWYLDRGYSTTRAYLPPQDLADGVLRILVLEGKREQVRLEAPDTSIDLDMAFPGLDGKVLNIRDLEQGLDQLNRVPSNSAKMDLVPGETSGGSRVVIKNKASKRWRASASMDNAGSLSTGRRQLSFGLDLDSPLGLNDVWTFSLQPDRRGESPSGSRVASGSVSLPYGYWTFGYSQNWMSYYDVIKGQLATYRSDGISRQHKATLERVVFRNADSKTSVEAALTAKQVRNYIEFSKLAVQSRKLTIGALTLRHATKLGGGALNLSLGHEWGLRTLGAEKDHQVTAESARAQFKKLSGDVSYSRPFKLAAQDLRMDLSSHVQWSPKTLYGSERISIGGQYSVRGFQDMSASGDVGGYVRSELSWSLAPSGVKPFDKLMGRFSPYIGVDGGAIRHDHTEASEKGALSGMAIGFRTSGGLASFDVAYAKPIHQPGSFTTSGGVVYAKLKLEY